MRPQKIADDQLMERIIPLFRNKGFEGTSMQDLSVATGLKKASLYHRFPGGKEDMVHAVMKYTGEKVKSNIIYYLNNNDLKPQEKLEKALLGISNFYKGGESPCLFRALSSDSALEMFVDDLQGGMTRWLTAFKNLGLDFGFSKTEAENIAMQTLTLIQGSLIVCKSLNTTSPFKSALNNIRKLYIK